MDPIICRSLSVPTLPFVPLPILTTLRPPQPTVPLSISPLLSANQTMRKRQMKICVASSPDDSGSMEENYWISGLNDPLLADLVTKNCKSISAMLAKLMVDATIRKLGAEVAEKDPLWADLVAESKLFKKHWSEYEDSVQNYILIRKPKGMRQEDFEERLHRTMMELNGYGRTDTKAIAYGWWIKYGFSLFQVDDDAA